MQRVVGWIVASLAIGAVAACGGSSSKSPIAGPSEKSPAAAGSPGGVTQATPANTASTPSTPATAPGVVKVPLPSSVLVTSPQFKAYLALADEKNGVPANKVAALEDCFVSKLEALGIKTVGDYKSANSAKAGPAAAACLKQAGVNVK